MDVDGSADLAGRGLGPVPLPFLVHDRRHLLPRNWLVGLYDDEDDDDYYYYYYFSIFFFFFFSGPHAGGGHVGLRLFLDLVRTVTCQC